MTRVFEPRNLLAMFEHYERKGLVDLKPFPWAEDEQATKK